MREQTAWTEKGLEVVKTKAYKDGNDVAKPGIHFVVVAPEGSEYYTFPEHPADIYSVFRHAWVLIRKKRPDVVIIEGLKMPSSARSDIENAKYCSLFFRPWTLLNGDVQVPHLALLGCSQTVLRQAFDVSRTPASKARKAPDPQTHSVQEHVQWHTTWNAYVRGHVVSHTAAQLIQSFLLKTLAVSGGHENNDEHSEADKSDEDTDVLPLRLSRAGLKEVLAPACLASGAENKSAADDEQHPASGKLKRGLKRHSLQSEYDRSIRTGCAVWATPETGKAADERKAPGHMFEDKVEEILAGKRTSTAEAESSHAPFDEQRNAAATWDASDAERTLDSTLASILAAEERPNAEQAAILQHVVRRLKLEVMEQRQRRIGSSVQQPLLDVVHGFPGTGKSRVIAWMRELMEKGLGWVHGTQFVCLAFQNVTAAMINGYTIHHWSGIPTRAVDGNTTDN
jgi:hypothetical protein